MKLMSQVLLGIGLTRFQPSPQTGFPAPDTGDKKFNSRLVAPTVFRKKPFGKNVEGLSYCGDKSCGSQIVFKWRSIRVGRSRSIDATSFAISRWAVQIPSPASTADH
jgi:hypothetical protein